MNRNILSNTIMFTVGAAVGSLVTWQFVKTKYEKIAQEEIESVKEVYSKRAVEEPKAVTPEKSFEVTRNERQERIQKYTEMQKELGYDTKTQMEGVVDETMDTVRPYVIAPDEVGDCDYEIISLTYYADGVLTDDSGEPIEDIDETVGDDFADHFGEYEDDSVFVRNDYQKIDYEILKDYERYFPDTRRREEY